MYFSGVRFMNIMLNLSCLKKINQKIQSILIKDNEVYKHMKCIVYTFMYTLKYQNLFFISIKLYWFKSKKPKKNHHQCLQLQIT
jgi:hypothetical protein